MKIMIYILFFLSLTSEMPINYQFTDISNIHIKNSNMNTTTKVHENLSLNNAPNEIFKDIPNYKGYYQVSNLGRIKNLKRKGILKERVLKSKINRYGYPCIALYGNNKRKTFTIHQLVAITFLNHKPNGYKLVVDHIDNNPLNNNLENLQLITQRENCSKDKKEGASKYIGVNWSKRNKKWISQIRIKGKRKYLGSFDNELKASQVYQKALKNV